MVLRLFFGFLFSFLENSPEDMVVQLGETGGDGSLGEEDFDQSEDQGSFLTILISPSCLD